MASIIEAIRTYVATCPLLDAKGRVNVDFLGEYPTEYSIEPIPSNNIKQKYVDGSSDRQYQFVFSSRESFGADVLQNMANSGFYEKFAEWLEEQTQNDVFPVLESGKDPYNIEALDIGYAIESGTDSARYQIQCALHYMQKGE